jgi:hypothetical protein
VEIFSVLRGRRVLVAAENSFLATFVNDVLKDAGALVIGPVPSISQALASVFRDALDAAVISDMLRGSMWSDPVAVALQLHEVPFMRMSPVPAPLIGGPPAIHWPFTSNTLLKNLSDILKKN